MHLSLDMKTVSRNYSPERVDSILAALLHHPEAHTGPIETKRQRAHTSSSNPPDESRAEDPGRDAHELPKFEEQSASESSDASGSELIDPSN